MRTRITTPQPGYVTVECDDPQTGERRTTTYFAPLDGGYVRVHDAEGRYPQVCERLSNTGSTLTVRSANELPGLIRRELRRRQAVERRGDC